MAETYKGQGMFRDLNAEEVKQFRKWARDNYIPGTAIETLYHPIVQDECAQMNIDDEIRESRVVERELKHSVQSLIEDAVEIEDIIEVLIHAMDEDSLVVALTGLQEKFPRKKGDF